MGKKKKIIIALLAVIVILAAGVAFIIMSINKYIDTHTWATIRISGEVLGGTADAYEEKREFLKGDTMSLAGGTQVLIEDIKHDGTVLLSFKPTVTDTDGNKIKQAEIADKEALYFKEKTDNGISASWMFQVTEHRYQ